MLYRLYVHQEHVIIPVVAQTEEGFYVDTPPVVRIHVSDTANWKAVLLEALEAGNQIIPTPEASDSGSSCLLETLKLEKWTTFEKRACMYTVHSGVSCIKMYRTGKAPDGMWGPNNQIEHTFPSDAPWTFIVHAIGDDIIKQPEAHPVKSGGLIRITNP